MAKAGTMFTNVPVPNTQWSDGVVSVVWLVFMVLSTWLLTTYIIFTLNKLISVRESDLNLVHMQLAVGHSSVLLYRGKRRS